MKRLVNALILALALMLWLAVPVLALDPPTKQSINVYRNLLETGDRLFVVYFNNPYEGAPPEDPASQCYFWELVDPEGVTVLGITTGWPYVYNGYGYQIISMYFPASAGLEWDPETPYTFHLKGNPIKFEDPPEHIFEVTSGAYTSLGGGADPETDLIREELTSKILIIAADLDLNWGLETSLLTEEETGTVLSTFGQAYFRGAIYSIQAMAPNLFPLALRNITIEGREWGDTYITELEEQYEGYWVETAKAAGATLFGTSFDMVTMIILFAGVIGIIMANVYLTNDAWNGLIDATFFTVIATKLGMLSLGYTVLIGAIGIIYIGLRLKQMGIFGASG